MDSVDLANKMLGPLGGNLNNPEQYPEHRKMHMNSRPVEGGHTLHQFIDTAMMGVKNEQPWHRMAAYMLLAGRTNSEIALAADVVPGTVSVLRAQRWFQELLATLANESGAELHGLLQAEAQDALNRIVDLAQNAESERVRLAANIQLLEQAHGKAVQKIISHNTSRTYSSPEEETAALLQELDTLRSRNVKTIPSLPCPNPS